MLAPRPKDYKDSNGTNVKGRFGTDRYWIREFTEGHWDAGKFQIMASIIVYDAFDYRGDGLVRRGGTVGPRFLNRAAAERHLSKILSKKEVIA